MARVASFLAVIVFAASSASGQTPVKKTPEQIQAAYEQHKGDFDYLLGDWEFITNNKQFGKSNGRWSAVKTATGQILDEYKLVDDKGQAFYVTATIRNYNAVADRWELIGMEDRNGLQDFGTARRVGDEMHIEQRFGVAGGTPNTLRIRYYNIRPSQFSWTADQSTDGGRTWVKDFIQIEARRTGPARTLPQLAKSK
jgi:hypothetical protein